MTAFANHFLFEFRTGVRNKNLFLLNYLFPLGFYLMMGFIMPQVNPLFRDAIVPALVTFAVMAATLLGLPDPLVTSREAGIFRSYKINGIPAASIVIIPALTTVLHLTVVAILITVSAPVFFDAPLPVNGLNYALVFLAFASASAGLGVLIGVVSPSSRVTVMLSQVVFLPSMLLGGLMLPYRMLPETVGQVARLMPATYAMNALNSLAMGLEADFAPWASVLVLFAGGLLAFALAITLFNWDERNSTRRGHPALGLLALLPYVIGLLLL